MKSGQKRIVAEAGVHSIHGHGDELSLSPDHAGVIQLGGVYLGISAPDDLCDLGVGIKIAGSPRAHSEVAHAHPHSLQGENFASGVQGGSGLFQDSFGQDEGIFFRYLLDLSDQPDQLSLNIRVLSQQAPLGKSFQIHEAVLLSPLVKYSARMTSTITISCTIDSKDH